MLTILDEFTRKCLRIEVNYSLKSRDLMEVLSKLFITEGVPEYIRSDNGSKFIAKNIQSFLRQIQVKTAYINPDSPWENRYNEGFNGILRDELINGEVFYTLDEAKVMT